AEPTHAREFALYFLQPGLPLIALCKIADEAGEVEIFSGFRFPDRELHRKSRAIFSASHHYPIGADDPFFSGLQIAPDIVVMLTTIRLRHQNPHVLPQNLSFCIAELTNG